MSELKLPHAQTMTLRARAHGLDPVVLLGTAGLSEAVLREIDRALRAHELIKVRAGRIDSDERDAMSQSVAESLGAAGIQAIGHTFVLFRPKPAREEARDARKESPSKSTKKSAARKSAPKEPARKSAGKPLARRAAAGKSRPQR